jgi:hypothetical protein
VSSCVRRPVNRAETAAIALGVGLTVGVLLAPPWVQCLDTVRYPSELPLDVPACYADGHHPLILPPQQFAPAWLVRIHVWRLVLEVLVIVCATGTFVWLLRRRRAFIEATNRNEAKQGETDKGRMV